MLINFKQRFCRTFKKFSILLRLSAGKICLRTLILSKSVGAPLKMASFCLILMIKSSIAQLEVDHKKLMLKNTDKIHQSQKTGCTSNFSQLMHRVLHCSFSVLCTKTARYEKAFLTSKQTKDSGG